LETIPLDNVISTHAGNAGWGIYPEDVSNRATWSKEGHD